MAKAIRSQGRASTVQAKSKKRGRWKKGESGNPGGRTKESKEVKELARRHTVEAIERLVFWMKSDNAKASVSAANALLDRAWGKAAQALTGEGGEGPVQVHIVRFTDAPAA